MFRLYKSLVIPASLSLCLSCAKKVVVNGRSIDNIKGQVTSATAKPVTLPSTLGVDRTYFQTRSTILLSISGPDFVVGRDFSLSNNTTKQVLIDRQILSLEDEAVMPSGISLFSNQAKVKVALHLLNPALGGKFTYPQDELQLTIHADPPIVSKKSIVLRDFRAGSMQVLHFDGNRQRSGSLQGELAPMQNAILRTDQTMLTTGFVPLINH